MARQQQYIPSLIGRLVEENYVGGRRTVPHFIVGTLMIFKRAPEDLSGYGLAKEFLDLLLVSKEILYHCHLPLVSEYQRIGGITPSLNHYTLDHFVLMVEETRCSRVLKSVK